jgi:hypothetical protein
MSWLKRSKEHPVNYQYLGRESIRDNLKNTIPRELIPSNLTGKIMGYIFLTVILISLFQFSTESFMSKDLTKKFNIGIPKPFLEFDLLNPSKSPLNKKSLIIDLFAYLFLAYSIEIFINLFKDTHLLDSKKDRDKIPEIFKTQKKRTFNEKVTKKAFEKIGVKNLLRKKSSDSNSNLNNSTKEKNKMEKSVQNKPLKIDKNQKNNSQKSQTTISKPKYENE